MFSLLYKSNIIKTKEKTTITFAISAITYAILHYIIFNDFFNSFGFIEYIHIGFYVLFFIDFSLFVKIITEDKFNQEIINSNKEKEAIENYYGKIFEQIANQQCSIPNMQNKESDETNNSTVNNTIEHKDIITDQNNTQPNQHITNSVIQPTIKQSDQHAIEQLIQPMTEQEVNSTDDIKQELIDKVDNNIKDNETK